jgi:hypothetical protein
MSRSTIGKRISSSGSKKRNYRSEYKKYHSKEEQKKNRASRNTARRRMTKAGQVTKGDKRDVSHRNGNPKDNRKSNLTVSSQKKNRSFSRTKSGKKVLKTA